MAVGSLDLQLATLGLLASSATRALASRSTVNFDFGWRFAASVEQRFEAQCSFEENMNFGQGSIWAGPTASKEECCSECANRELCMSWDWNGHLCYNKDNTVGAKAQHGRWSGRLGPSFTKNASFAWPGDQAVPVQAQLAYDDSSWEVVDAPHDFGRERMESCLGGGRRRRLSDESDGALTAEPIRQMQNCSGFYRKHFSLPAAWRGGVTYVYFEGVYHNSAMWLNGKPLGAHENGYTSFWRRIDTAGVEFGDGSKNVLAIYANGNPGAGFWYGGAGLNRHQFLVHTPQQIFLPPDRSWVHASDIGTITANSNQPGHGQRATATLVAEGVINNGNDAAASGKAMRVWVSAVFTMDAAHRNNTPVATAVVGPFTVTPGAAQNFSIHVTPTDELELWSVARPFLYTAQLQVHVGSAASPGEHAPTGNPNVLDCWIAKTCLPTAQ